MRITPGAELCRKIAGDSDIPSGRLARSNFDDFAIEHCITGIVYQAYSDRNQFVIWWP
jgi:hypothetical protein